MRKGHNDEDNSPKDKGDTWVSYSDLFTSLSIIFLTMFVFALLQAGLNKLEKIQAKKDINKRLEGKIPKSLSNKIKSQEDKLNKAVKEFEQHDKVISEKVLELNFLSSKIKEQNKVIKSVLNEQKQTHGVMQELRQQVEQKRDQVLKLQQTVEYNESELKNIKTRFVNSKKEVNQLEKDLEQKTKEIINNENVISNMQNSMSNLEFELRDREERMKETTGNLVEKNKIITETQELLRSKISDLERNKDALQKSNTKIKELRSKVDSISGRLESQELVIKQKNMMLDDLNKQITTKENSINSISKSLENAEKEIIIKQQTVNQLEEEKTKNLKNYTKLTSDLKKIREQAKSKSASLEKVISQNQDLLFQLKQKDKKIGAFEKENSILKESERLLREDNKSVSKELEALVKNKKQSERARQDLQESYAKSRQKVDDFQKKNQYLETIQQDLTIKTKELQASLVNTESLKKTLLEDLKESKNEKNILKDEILKISKINNQLKGKVNQLTGEVEKSSSKLKSAIVENKKLAQFNQGLDRKIQDITEKYNGMVDVNDKLEGNIKSLMAENKVVREQNKDVNQLANDLKEKLEKSALQSKRYAEQNKELNTKISHLISKKNELEKDLGLNLSKVSSVIEKNKNLKSMVSKIKTQKINAENTNQTLEGKLKESMKRISKTESENNVLKEKLKSIESQNQSILAEKNAAEAGLKDMISKRGSYEESNKSLKNKLKESLAKNNQFKKDNQKLLSKLSETSKVKRGITSTRDELQGKNEKLVNANMSLKAQLESYLKKQNDLQSQIASCENNTGKFKAKCLKDKNELMAKNKYLEKIIANGKVNVKDLKGKITHQIADNLSHKFKERGLKINTDPKSGIVTLVMDDNFLFKHGSAKLTKSVRKKLKELIPVYTKGIFENSKIAEAIDSIEVIGHASPVFNKRFVSPYDIYSYAYKFNMKLSYLRANNIKNFISSSVFGEFEHKDNLVSKFVTRGRGYSKPLFTKINQKIISKTYKGRIPRRIPSSLKIKKSKGCGPFDCKRSRRVEIKFNVKDDKATLIEAYFK